MMIRKLLSIVFLGVSLGMLTSTLASADRQCTNHVDRSNGEITITSDCTASFNKTSVSFLNRHLVDERIQNLNDKVAWGLQNLKDRSADNASSLDHSRQVIADLKDQQAMRLEQQQDKIQDLNDRK